MRVILILRDSLYLVLVRRKQLSGHLSVMSRGPKRFWQHLSLTQTERQKSGIWSARRTMRTVERYVLPLYLQRGKKNIVRITNTHTVVMMMSHRDGSQKHIK